MSRGTVILVPGFGGNELLKPGSPRGEGVIWVSTPRLAAFGLEQITLPLPDRPGLPPNGVGVEPGFVIDGVYRPCIQYLQLRDWEVIPLITDWRGTVAQSAADLLELVFRREAEWPLHVVAHSRGGLVTRAMLGLLSADSRPAAIGRCIGVGVPHTGSLNAVATLGNASDFVRNIRNAIRLCRGLYSFIRSGSAVDDALRSWPGLYELLPDPARSDLTPDGVNAVYSSLSYSDGGLPVWSPHLVAARAAWPAVPDVFPSVQWVDVAGYGIDTITGLAIPYDLTHRRGYVLDEGDGTVSLGVALKPGRVRILAPAYHEALMRDGRVLELVHQALVAMPEVDVRIRGPVAT